MAETARLEPNLGGGAWYFYPKPNPAFSEILLGERVRDLVYEYTAKVTLNYLTRLWARKHVHDRHIGEMEGAVRPEVFIGGFDNDRWVGEITVDVEYALADEFGRKNPAPGQKGSVYEGSHDLTGALYSELPARI
jgi:hypothetical protein